MSSSFSSLLVAVGTAKCGRDRLRSDSGPASTLAVMVSSHYWFTMCDAGHHSLVTIGKSLLVAILLVALVLIPLGVPI